MGFPACCAQLYFPKPFISLSDILGLLRNLVFFFFNLFGFSHFLRNQHSAITSATTSTVTSVTTSAAAVTTTHEVSAHVIKELLPVVLFGESGENACICVFCLSQFSEEEEIRRMQNCNHVFHRTCVDRWINSSQKTCPLCRTPFVTNHDTESMSLYLFPG
ncbi:E3 ubiquitin-protein ligase RHA1B-like [Vigna unguiculata]|uniref:E3 ubiquitin-protein ligase Praja2 n=1 Tax=Vigna unguiculata TaxID=3917 RepID=A0A4D6MMK9_VIGUN|nr:E3 ubiquitin-protein ligase RHA1B-like [Vigna unguiculata]QCE02716.1 E3 ubiquitin-protein ligase Praja2 [Vigna unguiculata]